MKRTLIACIFSLSISTVYANIKQGANDLVNRVDPNINMGIQVIDLGTGATLYQRNANHLFTPASNMKLFSDAAALMVLGPDYRFRNQLSLGPSKIDNGVLYGNIYLKLPGDPSFSRERLTQLLSSLKKWHINRIQGNVVIDSAYAAVPPYAPGRMAEDMFYSYGAPIAPVVIDTNRLTVTVNPAGQVNMPAIVEIDSISGSMVINNQVNTKPKGTRCGVDFKINDNNELTVRGCVAIGQWAVEQKMAIRNPLIYAQRLIKQVLIDANIVLDGQVVLGKTPEGAFMTASDASKPIAQLMADTLKPSDNLYADSLFLHAATKLKGAPVAWAEAQTLIKNFLSQQTHIALNNAVMVDGSGLSRQDLITPAQTAELLRFLYERFPLTYEYISALPISGRDGTLQKRFKRPEQQDMVRAKTGTMRGVISLSGYLYTANGHTLAFAIYVNRRPGTRSEVAGRYRYLVDALCSYFLQQKPSNIALSRIFSSTPRIKYQQNPTQAELQRTYYARWRQLEAVVKQALQGQAVTVLFRGNELVLQDYQPNAQNVLNALKNLSHKYSFAAALATKDNQANNSKPLILISNMGSVDQHIQRVWTIREAAR